MLNEWSDRADPREARSWWRIALDWAIGLVVFAGSVGVLVQIVLLII